MDSLFPNPSEVLGKLTEKVLERKYEKCEIDEYL